MKHETIEHEVAALWTHYTVIEKMTCAYSDCIENWVGDPARRMISADLQDTTGPIPRGTQAKKGPGKDDTTA